MSYKDHFSRVSKAYREYRPTYPPDLFRYLSSQTLEHTRAWDVGTGSGQAAVGLAPYYDEVVASDASIEQIHQAISCKHVRYIVCPAEKSPLPEKSVDLVTVAQALHWFDMDAFYQEAKRVMKPDGIIAVWAYSLQTADEEAVDMVIKQFNELLWQENCWPKERRLIDEGYRTISFPFKKISTPEFYMKNFWSLEELISYINTWSALERYKAKGQTLDSFLLPALTAAWPEGKSLNFRAKLILLVGRSF